MLVRGIDGEAELADLNALQESATREHANEGWLVSLQRVSQAVRERTAPAQSTNLFSYTFDELLDDDADFSGYLQWLEGEIQERHIDRSYVPLGRHQAGVRREGRIPRRCAIRRGQRVARGLHRPLARRPVKEHVWVLGEFGTGKTWFSLHYAWIVMQRYKDAKAARRHPTAPAARDSAPRLREGRHRSIVVLRVLLQTLRDPHPGLFSFRAAQPIRQASVDLRWLRRDGRTRRPAADDQQLLGTGEGGRSGVESNPDLSNRTLSEAKEGRALLGAELKASTANLTGEPPQFEVLELEKLDDDKWSGWSRNRTDPATADVVLRNPQLLDLARRPVMTEFILEALPDIKAGKRVDLARIYFYATTRKMERDIESGRTFTSLADKLYFLCEIAWEMLASERMSLNYRLFPDRLSHLFGNVVKEQKDLDHRHYDMMRNSMLIRNGDGDYQPAHRSLLEFFAAYKLTAELGMLADDLTTPSAQSNVERGTASAELHLVTVLSGGRPRPMEDRGDSPVERFYHGGGFPADPDSRTMAVHGRRLRADAVAHGWQHGKRAGARPGATGENVCRPPRRDEGRCAGSRPSGRQRGQPVGEIESAGLKGRELSGARLDGADLTGADLTECILNGASLQKARLVGRHWTARTCATRN